MNEVPFQSDTPDANPDRLESELAVEEEGFDLVNGPASKEKLLEGFYELHPDLIRADRIAGLIFFGVVTVGLIVGLIAKAIDGIDGLLFGLLGGAVVVSLGLLWLAIYWPKLEYRRTRWRLDEVGLEIHKGVLWRHRRVVPLARVQHADVGQGPLQRMYDLATLTVHTAGTQNSSVELSGLHHQVALHLRDRLVRQKRLEESVPSSETDELQRIQESTMAESASNDKNSVDVLDDAPLEPNADE